MRIGIYTRFWNTAGGGEVYAGGLAEVLAARHDVVLVSEEQIDTSRLRERLGLRVEALEQLVTGEVDDEAFARATAAFDVFVNCSHGSRRPNAARHGVFVVHFPEVADGAPASPAVATLRRWLHRGTGLRFGEGVQPLESDGQRSWRWTAPTAHLRVTVPRPGATLEIGVSTLARPEDAPGEIRVARDGVVVATHPPARERTSYSVPLPSPGEADVTIDIEPFSPRAHWGAEDDRLLGLQLESVALLGGRLVDRLAARAVPATRITAETEDYLDSYATLVSNSGFTQRWVRRRWGRGSERIEPPVDLRTPGPKDPIVLSVGRFFAPDSGHSKRQLEMVGAFRQLVDHAPGWQLHLVGGSSARDAAYLDTVRAATEGLPVHLHVNASRDELDELYRRAAIYWHAAGLGEDPRRRPERFEHFGISVVEAMSAGAVPVVLATGGPAEVVRRGIDGLHFRTTGELVRATADLVADDRRRSDLATSSQARAQEFRREVFAARALALVERIESGDVSAAARPGPDR